MSGITCFIGSRPGGNATYTRFSCFVKFSSLPSVATAIIDLNGSTTSYIRLKYDPTNQFVAEYAYLGSVLTANLCPSFTIVTNAWYWVSVIQGGASNSSWETSYLQGQVWGPGGSTPGTQTATYFSGQFSASVSYGVGWGVALTAYANIDNTPGTQLQELCLETSTGGYPGTRSPPTSAISPGGAIVGLWHVTDVLVGSNRTILDATANHYDMAVGPQGNVVVTDGAF